MKRIELVTVTRTSGYEPDRHNRFVVTPVADVVAKALGKLLGIEVPLSFPQHAPARQYDIEGVILTVGPATRTVATARGDEFLCELIITGPPINVCQLLGGAMIMAQWPS